jgi:hypothetical protein
VAKGCTRALVHRGAHVAGIDGSPQLIAIARRRDGRSRIEHRCGERESARVEPVPDSFILGDYSLPRMRRRATF